MQTLYRPKDYPQPIQRRISLMPPLATEIANRWMMGWPERVASLIKAGQYLPALTAQEEAEREAYSNETAKHLARHEIAQEHGLSLEPPMTSPSSVKTSEKAD